jgi:hypothetical protein
MRQVFSGFPGVFAFAVAFPADKILELMAVNMTVNDRIDFVLFFALNNHRFRWRWFAKTVVMPQTEVADIEDGIEVQIGEELEMIVEISDLFKNLVQAELLGSKLRHFLVDLNILSSKPDHVSNFENIGHMFVSFKLFLYLFLG